VQIILEALNADRGTAFDASDRETTVYVENMAIARAIAAAWGTNERLGNLWDPARMPRSAVARWEAILALPPLATDDDVARRARIRAAFERFGAPAINGVLTAKLYEALGDAFVAIEYISFANAVIQVPDGTYPWGVVGDSPWSSTVAHVLVRLQKPAGWSEGDFYEAAGKVGQILDPELPAWCTFDWYRPGPISVNVPGGPSAAGFYLDTDANLDNACFDV
jgi:hypothetical protein